MYKTIFIITIFTQLRFDMFAGSGFPVTRVPRQLNFYKVTMSAQLLFPKLEDRHHAKTLPDMVGPTSS